MVADLAAASFDELCAEARRLREVGHGSLVTYSPKVFIPLTKLCRDVCHYCTFARPPRRGERAYMSGRGGAGRSARRRRCWLSRGALHARGQAGAPVPGGARRARRARLRDDARVPRALCTSRARRDRAAAASEPGCDDCGGPGRSAAGECLAGTDARDGVGTAVGPRRSALRVARQASGSPSGDDRGRRGGPRAVDDRDPDRNRGDAGRAGRGAVRDSRPRRAVRSHPGSDRPELPGEGGDRDGPRTGAGARRASVDGGNRADPARRRVEHPGAAESELRGLSAAARRRRSTTGAGSRR